MSMIIDALEKVPFFHGISAAGLRAVAEICVEKWVSKKQILFLEWDAGHSIYFCIEGNIQLYKTIDDGKEVVIKLIKPGEIFAEVVLFEKAKYPVSAIALTRCRIFEPAKRQFISLLERADFKNDFIAMLMRKQRVLADQIKYLTGFEVQDRLLLFLKEQFRETGLYRKVEQKKIATAIGTTPETLSRVLLRLKSAGILDWSGDRIKINGYHRPNSVSGI